MSVAVRLTLRRSGPPRSAERGEDPVPYHGQLDPEPIRHKAVDSLKRPQAGTPYRLNLGAVAGCTERSNSQRQKVLENGL